MSNQSLGQYFTELRLSTPEFPTLGRAEVEAMGAERIEAEMRRRSYRLPLQVYRGLVPLPVTWVKHFLAKQAASRNTMSSGEVARRTGVDPAMIWRLEHGKPVGVETVRDAFTKGLGYGADSPEVRRALALWTGGRSGVKVDVDLGQKIADVQKNANFNEFLQRAVPVLSTISPRDYDAVLEALSNPATVESLAALNKLAATAGKPKLRVVPKERD